MYGKCQMCGREYWDQKTDECGPIPPEDGKDRGPLEIEKCAYCGQLMCRFCFLYKHTNTCQAKRKELGTDGKA